MDEFPSVNVLVLELLIFNPPIVRVCPLVSSVPFVKVSVAPVAVNASENIQLPLLAALKVVLPRTFPPVVTVCTVADVLMKLIAEVVVLPSVYVIPDTNFNATFPVPAVASPIESVTLALCVRVPT